MEKAREHQIDLYICFIDYKNAFDCVDHERLWVILRDMVVLLRRLYTNQKATVRTERHKTSTLGKECDWDVSSHHCYSISTQKT